WSSDVCSSDLSEERRAPVLPRLTQEKIGQGRAERLDEHLKGHHRAQGGAAKQVTPPTHEPGEQWRAIGRRSQPVVREPKTLGEVTRQAGVFHRVVLRARDPLDMEIGDSQKQSEREEQDAPEKRFSSSSVHGARLNLRPQM